MRHERGVFCTTHDVLEGGDDTDAGLPGWLPSLGLVTPKVRLHLLSIRLLRLSPSSTGNLAKAIVGHDFSTPRVS